MSYDLDALHQKYGLNVASLRFATISDAAGTTFIPGTTGRQVIIHQVLFTASSWCEAQFERATGAASAYWVGYAGQTQMIEPTRVVIDAGASVTLDLASIAVVSGSGVIRAWYTYQPAPTTGGAGIGNL